MIWFTSDCHFNHNNIIKFEKDSRNFQSVNEMNEVLINNWNSVVKKEDTVYVLGDFFMGQLTEIPQILKRLNGTIILIRGNHDTKQRIELFQQHGIVVKDIEYLSYKGKFFILLHFPLPEEFQTMVSATNKEVIALYGHIHSNAPSGFINNCYHVGVDTNNLTPISIEEILRKA